LSPIFGDSPTGVLTAARVSVGAPKKFCIAERAAALKAYVDVNPSAVTVNTAQNILRSFDLF
jgi:hypothetical protein